MACIKLSNRLVRRERCLFLTASSKVRSRSSHFVQHPAFSRAQATIQQSFWKMFMESSWPKCCCPMVLLSTHLGAGPSRCRLRCWSHGWQGKPASPSAGLCMLLLPLLVCCCRLDQLFASQARTGILRITTSSLLRMCSLRCCTH